MFGPDPGKNGLNLLRNQRYIGHVNVSRRNKIVFALRSGKVNLAFLEVTMQQIDAFTALSFPGCNRSSPDVYSCFVSKVLFQVVN